MNPAQTDLLIEALKYVMTALVSSGGSAYLTWRVSSAEALKIRAEADEIAQRAETERQRLLDARQQAIDDRLLKIHNESQEIIQTLYKDLDRKEDVIRSLSDQLRASNERLDKLRDQMTQAALQDREHISTLIRRLDKQAATSEALLELIKERETGD